MVKVGAAEQIDENIEWIELWVIVQIQIRDQNISGGGWNAGYTRQAIAT